MYNPTRMNPNAPGRNRQRRFDPHAGRKHSDIVAQQGPKCVFISDLAHRITTDRGWKIVHFSGDDFEVIYEYLCSRNTTGRIVHKDGDRCVRVMSGQIFIMVGGEQTVLRMGQAFSLPKGTEHEIATLGTEDAEVIFCQTKDYEDNIEQITEANARNTKMAVVLPTDRGAPQKISTEKARQAASRIQNQRQARERAISASLDSGQPKPLPKIGAGGEEDIPMTAKARLPLANQNVTGSSPMPLGAGGFDD